MDRAMPTTVAPAASKPFETNVPSPPLAPVTSAILSRQVFRHLIVSRESLIHSAVPRIKRCILSEGYDCSADCARPLVSAKLASLIRLQASAIQSLTSGDSRESFRCFPSQRSPKQAQTGSRRICRAIPTVGYGGRTRDGFDGDLRHAPHCRVTA